MGSGDDTRFEQCSHMRDASITVIMRAFHIKGLGMRQLLNRVSEDYLLLALVLALPLLLSFSPTPLAELPRLIDWSTLAALTGLMIFSRGLEDSGSLAV